MEVEGNMMEQRYEFDYTVRVVIMTEWSVMCSVLCGQVADLGRVCEHVLLQHVDTDTALCLLSIADQFQSTTLKVGTNLTPITVRVKQN